MSGYIAHAVREGYILQMYHSTFSTSKYPHVYVSGESAPDRGKEESIARLGIDRVYEERSPRQGV
jgi:hypothetical protein